MKYRAINPELLAAFFLALVVFVSVPVWRQGLGLSWDSMNHHVYLGWIASESRFDRDYFAASSQSYQFPYLYWPIYQMMRLEMPGWAAGVVWSCAHALVAIPLWFCSRALICDDGVVAAIFRLSGVMLSIGTILALRAPETTGNDLLAAIPYMSALALGLQATRRESLDTSFRKNVVTSVSMGLLVGVGVAFKLSNGVLAPLLVVPCFFMAPTWKCRLALALSTVLSIGAGFLVVYGWWGWQLWLHFGNPVFPFADGLFQPWRSHLGWVPLY